MPVQIYFVVKMNFLKCMKSLKVRNKLLVIIFDESSIHGMTQVLQNKRHLLERYKYSNLRVLSCLIILILKL